MPVPAKPNLKALDAELLRSRYPERTSGLAGDREPTWGQQRNLEPIDPIEPVLATITSLVLDMTAAVTGIGTLTCREFLRVGQQGWIPLEVR